MRFLDWFRGQEPDKILCRHIARAIIDRWSDKPVKVITGIRESGERHCYVMLEGKAYTLADPSIVEMDVEEMTKTITESPEEFRAHIEWD